MTKSLKVPSLYIIIVLAFDTDFILGLNKVKGKGKCGGKCLCLFHIIITSVLTTLTVFLPSLVPLHTVAHHWPTCCECAAGCNVWTSGRRLLALCRCLRTRTPILRAPLPHRPRRCGCYGGPAGPPHRVPAGGSLRRTRSPEPTESPSRPSRVNHRPGRHASPPRSGTAWPAGTGRSPRGRRAFAAGDWRTARGPTDSISERRENTWKTGIVTPCLQKRRQ